MDVFERIAAQLGDGPWLLGQRFSAADLYLLLMTRWGSTLPTPVRSFKAIAAHAERTVARPAVIATYEAEQKPAPLLLECLRAPVSFRLPPASRPS